MQTTNMIKIQEINDNKTNSHIASNAKL